MVNAVTSNPVQQSYTTVQPSFTSEASRVNTEQVQPRQAPASGSQGAAPRESRDEVVFQDAAATKNPAQQPVKTDFSGERGSILNLVV